MAANVNEVMGTPEKRDWFIRYLLNVRKELREMQHDIRTWKPIVQQDAELQDSLRRVGDPVEKARIEEKLHQDGLRLAAALEAHIPDIETAWMEGKKHDVDVVFKAYRKVEKGYEKVSRRKRYNLNELFYIVEFVGAKNKDEIHKILKGKQLRYQAERFIIEGYFYRIDTPQIKLAEIDELIPLKKEVITEVLDKKIGAFRKGLVQKNDVLPEHIIQFVQANRQMMNHDQLLEKLKQFRIKQGMHLAHIDDVDLEQNTLHLQDYPKDVWVLLSLDPLRKAVVIRSFIKDIEAGLKATYVRDVEHVIKGIDREGKELKPGSLDQLRAFPEFKKNPTYLNAVKLMRSSLVVRTH